MNLTVLDHAVFALLAIALPAHGWWAYRRFTHQLTKEATARAVQYRQTTGWLWAVFGVVLALWIGTGRPLELLGVRVPTGLRFWLGLGLAALIVGFFVYQLQITRQSADARAQVQSVLGDVAPLLPRTLGERRWFGILCFTAGVVEEFTYRGFLIWYLGEITNLWFAVMLSAVVFGIAHAYQGLNGIVKTGTAGLVLALLYVGTGSIWVPMLVHWLVDDIQGRTAFEAFSRNETAEA